MQTQTATSKRGMLNEQIDRAIIGDITLRASMGATVRELVDSLGYAQVSISPRMVHLERAGVVVRTGRKRKHSVTGAHGIVWVTPKYADPAPGTVFLQWDPRHWGEEVTDRATWSKSRQNDDDIKYERVR